jgi:hypothetical protein
MESSRHFCLLGEIERPLTLFVEITDANAQVADGQWPSGRAVCYCRHLFTKL